MRTGRASLFLPLADVYLLFSTMAPTDATVKWQTGEIIKYLLADEEESECRIVLQSDFGVVEADGPEDDFDPVQIADKLRTVADALNEDFKFQAALADLKKAAAQEAAEAAFTQGVEAFCQSHVVQSPEVTAEMQLIRASVIFGLYVKKSCPDLKSKVQSAMTAFLNRRVGSWVTQQGGWAKVDV